jgi:hypothetical protein
VVRRALLPEEKKARGDGGGTSVPPVIPLFPVGSWLAGFCLDRLSPGVGLFLVRGAHLLLTIVFLGSALLSAAKIGAGGGRGFAAGGRDRKVS